MDHEVFHAQRFTRIDGELLCIVHESDKDDNDVTDNGPDKVVRKLGFFLVCLFVLGEDKLFRNQEIVVAAGHPSPPAGGG